MQLNEVKVLGHDDIEVDTGVFVLGVVEIENGGVLVNAGADARDELFHREAFDFTACDELVQRDGDGNTAASDRCCAGAAVCLKHVTIKPDGAWSKCLKVDHGAHGASDETLDL